MLRAAKDLPQFSNLCVAFLPCCYFVCETSTSARTVFPEQMDESNVYGQNGQTEPRVSFHACGSRRLEIKGAAKVNALKKRMPGSDLAY